jgi:hypothetical protein
MTHDDVTRFDGISLSLSLSLPLYLSLSLSLSFLSLGHKNTNVPVPLILKVLEIIIFVWGKTYNGAFLGVFRRGLTFLTPKLPAKKNNNIRDFQNQRYINPFPCSIGPFGPGSL